jgi:hypothetical protein
LEAIPRDITAERILDHLNEVEHYSDEAVAPYWTFSMDGHIYYLTSGGFLYRKDPGTEGVGGFFCGYLTDGVWHYRSDGDYWKPLLQPLFR